MDARLRGGAGRGRRQRGRTRSRWRAGNRPDVIVVDHLLGDVTSEALAPRLRAAAPEAKLLLISGMHEEALTAAATAAGADAYLSKAASARALCDLVRSLLP